MANKSACGGSLTAKPDGAKLKLLRGKTKQHIVEVACGMSSGYLTRFENSKPVSIKMLLKVADYYKVFPKELLSEEGLTNTKELLMDLASIHGVRIDFGTNGEPERALEVFDTGFHTPEILQDHMSEV